MGRYEVRIAGFGGQGVITMGYVLANAACIHDGRHTLMTQSYGPEARGGACRADVIISDEPIDYPKVASPDCLVAMSADAYRQFHEDTRERGILVYESDLITIDEVDIARGISCHGVGAVREAKSLDNLLSANVVMLGAMLEVTGVVGTESVRKAVEERWPRFAKVNLKALERGMEVIKASR